MLRHHKSIILGTSFSFLAAIALSLILAPPENAGLGRGNGFVRTLGARHSGTDATGRASPNYTADRSELVDDAYAYFRLVELDIQVGDYDAIATHVDHVISAEARNDVAILAIDALLKQPCLTEASVDSDAPEVTVEQRRKSMSVILDLVGSLRSPMLRSAYMTRIAEIRYQGHAGSDDREWRQLKENAEAEAAKIVKPMWWWDLDYRYWLTLVITACGFVLSIIVREVVAAYSKTVMATRLERDSNQRVPARKFPV